jgi:hypothetical protein
MKSRLPEVEALITTREAIVLRVSKEGVVT